MYTSGSYFEVLVRFLGNYIDPQFFLSSFSRLIIFFVVVVLLVFLPYIFLIVTTIFSGTDKQLHRYIGKATRVFGYLIVSPPPYINLAYCTETTQLPMVIIGCIAFAVHVVFISVYHFFVFESNLSKPSLLRARSGRTMAIMMKVVGFTLRLGNDTYIYRKAGFPMPSITRLPSIAPLSMPSVKQFSSTGSLLGSPNPITPVSPSVASINPSILTQAAPISVLSSINPSPASETPRTPTVIQAPTIILQPSVAILPKLATTPAPTSSRDADSLLQKMRDSRAEAARKKQPQTIVLDENNLRDIVPLIAKNYKDTRKFREALQFLQTPELSNDAFTVRMVDQTFRRLVAKDWFGLKASVRIDYGIFLMQNMGAQYRMGLQIQKAVELFPDWTDRWLSFVLTKEMEKKQSPQGKKTTGNNLEKLRIAKINKPLPPGKKLTFAVNDEDAVNAFARPSDSGDDNSASSKMYNLQAQLSQAHKHYISAMHNLQIMWMYLGRRNVDCAKVQTHALRAMHAEKEATHLYISLLTENPDNPNVMRPFARLLRDVTFDDEASNMLIQESDRVEDMNESFIPIEWGNDEQGESDDGGMSESSVKRENTVVAPTHTENSPQSAPKTTSASLSLFLNQLKANEPKKSKLDNLILPLNIFSLVGVLVITIAAYVIANTSFVRFVVQSGNLRATLFTAMSAEEIAYLLATMAHLSQKIPDHTNLVTDQDILYYNYLSDLIDELRPAFDTFNNYVQAFYKACDKEWFSGHNIPYSVPKNLVGGKIGTRFDENLQLRQVFYRTQERSLELADSHEAFFDDLDGFTMSMVECQMNTHLVITEEVKLLGQWTMDKIASIATTGMMSMIGLLIIGTALLLLLASLPLAIKIRSTNKKGREKMIKVCSVSVQTARMMSERLELSSHDSTTADMDSETSSLSKKDQVEENEEMAAKEEEERSDDAAEKLKKMSGVVPGSIIASLVVGTLLIVFVSYTFFILAFVAMRSVSELSRLIILSGYRRIYLNTLLCFDILSLTPTVFPPLNPEDDTIVYKTDKYSGVILWNTSFIHDPNEISAVIRRTSSFLTLLGAHFLNGLSEDVTTGDEFYDSLATSGARGRYSKIDDINTREDDCFLENRTQCDEKDRLGSFSGSFHGLLEVLSTILDRSIQMSHDDSHAAHYEDDDVQFVLRLTTQDAQSSLKQIGAFLQEELDNRITIFETALVIVIVVVSILEVVFALIFLAPLSTQLRKIDANVLQLDRLSTSGEDAPLEWTDELATGLIRMDSQKEMLYQLFEALREQVSTKAKMDVIQQTVDQIILITISIFYDEEELMLKYEYPSAQTSEHIRQHALLFKRLVDFALDSDKKRPSLEKTKRFVSTWIQSHMASADADLSLFLRQTLSPSEMNTMADMNETQLPSSVVQFYRRSNLGMEDKMGVTALLERNGFDLLDNSEEDDGNDME
ncbi:putative hemerythrin [Blattamonas nauphoetae]|uniref:Hemerythrin n=1 Tax=Blattamonas nauphoetae TaxID=2049346 RepID=A0ABQ9X811_9EUKA|nr:putative hemerythrin [Blattamonas nauphoetae]